MRHARAHGHAYNVMVNRLKVSLYQEIIIDWK